jgi:hypothetical protein
VRRRLEYGHGKGRDGAALGGRRRGKAWRKREDGLHEHKVVGGVIGVGTEDELVGGAAAGTPTGAMDGEQGKLQRREITRL